MTAWVRVQLMGDTALRSWFYGPSCKLTHRCGPAGHAEDDGPGKRRARTRRVRNGEHHFRRARLRTPYLRSTLSSLCWSSHPSGYLDSPALCDMAWRTNSVTNVASSVSAISNEDPSVSAISCVSVSAQELGPPRSLSSSTLVTVGPSNDLHRKVPSMSCQAARSDGRRDARSTCRWPGSCAKKNVRPRAASIPECGATTVPGAVHCALSRK